MTDFQFRRWHGGRLVKCDAEQFATCLRRHAEWAEKEFNVRSDAAANLAVLLRMAADAIDNYEANYINLANEARYELDAD